MPYVFDAYGTLFDFHAAIARHRAAAGPDADRFSELWRHKQIEYTWTHTLAGRYVEFWTLTQRALDYCFERFPSVDRKLRDDLLDAYLKLDAFPDAHDGAARAEGARRSHRHPVQRLAGDARHRRSRPPGSKADLDAVLSVDTVKMFKPRPEVYALVTSAFCGQARRGDVRLVEPLGRDGRDRLRLPHRLGQPRQGAGRVLRISRRQRRCPDLTGLLSLRLSGAAIAGSRPCRTARATASRPSQKPHFEQPPSDSPSARRQPGWSAA